MTIRVLSAADIDRALTAGDAVDAMRSAFGEISAGTARVPVRGRVDSSRGLTLLMPAFLEDAFALGAKVVSVFPGNRDQPAITGAILMLDAETGRPRALLDGTRLTAIRTAAGSALATELLADPGANVLAVFGAGAQARSHIEIISGTRPLGEIRICARSIESAARLAGNVTDTLPLVPAGSGASRPRVRAVATPTEAVAEASLVVAATTSSTPVFDGRQLASGAHVCGVGSFTPGMQEVDLETIRRARVIVDQRAAVWEEAGDLIIPLEAGDISEDVIDCELGDIVNGVAPTGRDGRDLTFFKSVGNAAQDVAIAATTLRLAEARDLGTVVPF